MKLQFTKLCLVWALLTISVHLFADESHLKDPYVKTFIKDIKRLPDAAFQNELKNSPAWLEFISRNKTWNVRFDEENGLPLTAYGKPVAGIISANPKEIADAFIASELSAFNLPLHELVYRNTSENSKYYYVHFRQFHKNLEILFAHYQIKMTRDGRVMLFSMNAHNKINMNVNPALSPSACEASAVAGIGLSITGTTYNNELKILPVPGYRSYKYHLVYEITVDARDAENFPHKYYTLVDAHSGEVLYRHSLIDHASANMDINMSATLYATHPYNPTSVEPLKHQRIVVGGNTYYTDNTGYLGLTNTSPVTANIDLRGRWANVRTNGVTPTWTTTLNPGINNLTYDPQANIKELSAYHAVQEVHDYYQSIATGTAAALSMDFVMVTNVDEAGSCNAFYNGDINFFVADATCNATSLIADVVYHEYGHAINYEAYQDFGGNFGNGALGEGYADLWANGITEDPVLGIGFYAGGNMDGIRRYDINKKVYPKDLVGEVHADGEIIAGCWWDLGLNFGDHQIRQAMLFETYPATLSQPNGNEGTLFWQILIETLTNDDNDGDITNGTPNYCKIVGAFEIHGIFVSGNNVDLTHSEITTVPGLAPITVDVSMTNALGGSFIDGFYKINNAGSWNPFSLSNTSGLDYSGTIPGQPNGTIISYYFTLSDTCVADLVTKPALAGDPVNPNLPYYVLAGCNLLQSQDMQNANANWFPGFPGDNATTGMWQIVDPIPSFLNSTNLTGMVQTGDDHSPVGALCAITQNAPNQTSPAGTADVDGGFTTLLSEQYDLSSYTNPVFTYWRWYSNDQGATPGTDYWQVAISNDGAVTFVPIENTNVSDHSWRKFAFRVSDYVTPTSDVYLRFIAEDANAGSLIEAGVDDVELWDEIPVSIQELNNFSALSVYPNPVKNTLNIRWNQIKSDQLNLRITDHIGKTVFESSFASEQGVHSMNIPVQQFASGVYFIRIQGNISNFIRKINVLN